MKRPFSEIYPITQVFGANPSYYAQFKLQGHEGVDFGTPVGTPIFASEDGVVIKRTFSSKDYGEFICIWHKTLALATWYCHLKDQVVNVGDNVVIGQLIGHSGNTGNTTGPHLHFGMVQTNETGTRINKDNGYQGFIDPMPYLDVETTDDNLAVCQKERLALQNEVNKVLKPRVEDLEEQLQNANNTILQNRHELEGIRNSLIGYQNDFKELARQLSGETYTVLPDRSSISGAIEKLLGEEDELITIAGEHSKCQTKIDDLTKSETGKQEEMEKTNLEAKVQADYVFESNNLISDLKDDLAKCQSKEGVVDIDKFIRFRISKLAILK